MVMMKIMTVVVVLVVVMMVKIMVILVVLIVVVMVMMVKLLMVVMKIRNNGGPILWPPILSLFSYRQPCHPFRLTRTYLCIFLLQSPTETGGNSRDV